MNFQKRIGLWLALLAFGLGGCTTHPVSSLPISPSSFLLSPEAIRQSYPAIPEYENHSRGWSANTPLESSLVYTWGKPDQTRYRYSYLGAEVAGLAGVGALFGTVPTVIAGATMVAIRPGLPEYYYWKRGNYCIEAYVDKTIAHLYQKRLLYWTWHDRQSPELPEECR